jgi:hypothetical protein
MADDNNFASSQSEQAGYEFVGNIEGGSAGKTPEYTRLVDDPETGEQKAISSTEHLHNRPSFGRFGPAGQVYRGSSDISCEASHPGAHGHSGPATHFFTAEGETEEQRSALCANHLTKAQEHAYKTGKMITVRPIRPEDVEKFKIQRAAQKLEIRTGLEGILLSSGLTGEDAIVARKTAELGGRRGKSASATDLADSRTEDEKATALESALKNPSPRSKPNNDFEPIPSRTKLDIVRGQPITALPNLTDEQRSRGGRKKTARKLVAGEGTQPLGEGTGSVDAAFRHYVLGTSTDEDVDTILNMSTEEHNIALDTINMARERENLGIPQEGIVSRGFAKGSILRRERPVEDEDPTVIETQIDQPRNRSVRIAASIKPIPEETYGGLEAEMTRIAQKKAEEAANRQAIAGVSARQREIEAFKTGNHGDGRRELPPVE